MLSLTQHHHPPRHCNPDVTPSLHQSSIHSSPAQTHLHLHMHSCSCNLQICRMFLSVCATSACGVNPLGHFSRSKKRMMNSNSDLILTSLSFSNWLRCDFISPFFDPLSYLLFRPRQSPTMPSAWIVRQINIQQWIGMIIIFAPSPV